jgi:outer membrane murein-binding lipoprotein Lpp
MRGYLSFILVLLATSALLSAMLIAGSASSTDFSKAISAERAYLAQMDAKEAAMEAMRQGVRAGFSDYDKTHSTDNCRHCPGACMETVAPFPRPPNYCDTGLCGTCFRESEARAAAEAGAQERLSLLRTHRFYDDLGVSIGAADAEVLLRPAPEGKNGFALDSVRLRSAMQVNASSDALSINGYSELPRGMVIR